jgi:hypothetical protein
MVKDLVPESERPPLPTGPARAKSTKPAGRRRSWKELHPHDRDDVNPSLD